MSLLSRLSLVEGRLRPREELRGAIELHVREGWASTDLELVTSPFTPCSEHGPPCGVSVTPIAPPVRRVYVFA